MIAAAQSPAGAANPVLPPLAPGQSGSATTTLNASTGNTNQSARTFVPNDWLQTANSGLTELSHEYATSPAAFDTSAVSSASADQQARDLAQGMAAANNAANDYTSRTRQAGGSGAASGLIKAQGIISATDAAGKAKLDQTKYEVAQREAAATHSAQIASTLAQLRDSYLGHLVGRDTTGTSNDIQVGSQRSINQAAETGGGGGGGSSWAGIIPNASGAASGLDPFQVNARTGQYSTPTSATNLTGPWNTANFGG